MTSTASAPGRERLVDGHDLSAALAGDKRAFAALVERHRAELHLHCYRFMGSTQDAEDLVQETFLRAWSKRASFQGRSTFRAWLYGIATNASLDALRSRPRRVTPPEVTGPADPRAEPRPATDVAWLEPYPDRLLENVVASGVDPEAMLIRREATELAFLAAIQHLPPRQRAVLILRDVLEWSAKETATSLDMTVASVNSALQRARETLKRRWVRRDADRHALSGINEAERSLLARMVDAWDRTDVTAVATLLGADARLVMPPTPSWYDGREAITTFLAEHAFTTRMLGRMRALATAANRQPALGVYLRDDAGQYRPFALIVLTVEAGAITEMTLFQIPRLFALCGLPAFLGTDL
ncbi:MAG TPA: RNA polymerase subunit sigma-70 [Pseudonocardia sp.]|uniref:RNA polymerase subunit sigma-70 n=1 Tax=Pseudonocardia sp. TaxID=60912 RepID=UPI002EDAB4E0